MFLQGGEPNVSESLQPGYRAVSLEIPAIRGGMTAPGNFVDVLFRSEAQSATSDPRVQIPEATMTLFEGVEVIALEKPQAYRLSSRNDSLDIRLANGRDRVRTTPPRITMAVTLQQANILRTVEGRGEITLAPRSVNELVSMTPPGTTTGSGSQTAAESAEADGAAVNADPADAGTGKSTPERTGAPGPNSAQAQ